MELLTKLISDMAALWYVVIPEILYAVFAGFCFFGPGGVIGLLLYAVAFIFAPKFTMTAVGVIMAVHLFFFLGKGFIGDRIAEKKKPNESEEYRGIPKLSGDSADVQKALDRNKESSGKNDKTC